MLEVVPEAIVIYDPKSNEVVMANTELFRLVKKYSKLPIDCILQPRDRLPVGINIGQ